MSQPADLFIANRWVQGGGKPFQSRNPANQEVIWEGNFSNSADVDAAVAAAKAAFPIGPTALFRSASPFWKLFAMS